MSENRSTIESLPFNTPIESGLRSLVTLTEAFPARYDLQRLLFFDYLLVHSSDAGGPESLHPGTPYRSGEVLVRRGLVEEGLKFLVNRGLIEQRFGDEGITYLASEYATPFLECLQARYTRRLKERAKWLIETFGPYSDEQLSQFFNSNLDRWGSEFEHEAFFRELPEWNPLGFHLDALRVTGHDKPVADVGFRAGLNVISGASDTGKSYILQCINFMLGGSKPPKTIEESKGYNLAYLAIKSLAGEALTFERALKGGDFRVFAGDIDSTSKTEGRIIAAKHNADTDENISTHLLNICGLRRKIISKNQKGGTRSLSFRDVVRLLIVNETRIFVEGSPILSEKLYWSEEKSTFKLLLTGEDSSGIIVAQTSETVRAQRQGQLELVDELIANSETELAELTTDAVGVEDQSQRASQAINQLTQSIAENQAELSQQEEVRRRSYETIQEIDSRRIAIRELLARFDLLRDRYNSDLDRLNSIREANSLFFEISPQPCPVCGADGQPLESVSREQIENACVREASKIGVLLKDLLQTTRQLASERDDLVQQRRGQLSSYQTSTAYIQQELMPVVRKSKAEIDELLGTRQRLERAKQVINQLDLLKAKKATLSQALPKRPKLTTPTEVKVSEFEGLCREIESLLEAWHYPDVGPVRFSETDQDIVIKNRERKSPGKGFRALSYAAFVIGLMKFCRKNDLPHPGFVVLDSPLVAYKDPEAGDENITRSNVKEAFYRNLASTPQDEQIIVLENQNPPPDVQASINWIHFTRAHGVGRYGFFPV